MPPFGFAAPRLPSATDQPATDSAEPESPLDRLTRLILTGQIPEEMRPHVAREIQSIRDDYASPSNLDPPTPPPSGYSQLVASLPPPPARPLWGRFVPPPENVGAKTGLLGGAWLGRVPDYAGTNIPEPVDQSQSENQNSGNLPIVKVGSPLSPGRTWGPGFSPPSVFIPGSQENRQWTDHAIRGATGLFDAIQSLSKSLPGNEKGASKPADDSKTKAGDSAETSKKPTEDCHKRREEEEDNCYKRKYDYAHQSFMRACMQRAQDRFILCMQNGHYPELPAEWGLADEEVFRNLNR